jgi:opacity protein-like surface antigen
MDFEAKSPIIQSTMKYYLFFLLVLCTHLQAQNLHAVAKFGLGGYSGELKNTGFGQTAFAWSIGAKYDLSERLAARANLCFTKLTADDAKSKRTTNLARNLNFTAKLREISLEAQYNIFSLNERWWTPYVFAGVSGFIAKPYTQLGGTKIYLQPQSTEGQGILPAQKKYSTTNIAIPFGFGGEYALSEDVRVGVEIGYRKTFTDYIDDVSTIYVDPVALAAAKGPTAVALAHRGAAPYPIVGLPRGNSKSKDSYYFFQLTFSVRPFVDQYKRDNSVAGLKRSKKVGCPQTKGIF